MKLYGALATGTKIPGEEAMHTVLHGARHNIQQALDAKTQKKRSPLERVKGAKVKPRK